LLYPIAGLRKAQGYHRTDTHLDVAGQVAVVEELLTPLLPESDLAAYRRTVTERQSPPKPYVGDLGVKFDPPISELTPKLNPDKTYILSGNGMQGGNDGLMLIARNSTAPRNERVLLFADSYFRQLIVHLSLTFQDVVFCRTRFFHTEMLNAVRPSFVFCGLAERYLSRVTLDQERPHFLSYPYLLGRPTNPDTNFQELFADNIDAKALAQNTQISSRPQ
jgi:hypothetical protein